MTEHLQDEVSEDGVRVGPARYGKGVYATRRFLPDEPIGRVTGRTICDPSHESDYCMDLGGDMGLEPEAPFRYLNHACRPNCELAQIDVYDDDDRFCETQMWVYALTEIEPGEQLLIDYAWPAEVAIPCGCEGPDCRGWIVAADEAHHLAGRTPPR